MVDVDDKAMTESICASIKGEFIDRRAIKTTTEARRAVFNWIEGGHKPRCRHSDLDHRYRIRKASFRSHAPDLERKQANTG